MKIKKSAKKSMTIEDLALKMDELVTKGMLDDVVAKISAKIEEIDEKIGSKVDEAVGNLAIMVEKGFAAMAKQADLLALTKRVDNLTSDVNGHTKRFDTVLSELKEVHKEIKINKLKTQSDIASLDFRVDKLEKKVPL